MLSLQESSSFKTFAGNLDVLILSSPLWVILENVDLGSDEGADSNSAMVSEQLASVGYTTRRLLCAWFGCKVKVH